jgi:hypothetical protein
MQSISKIAALNFYSGSTAECRGLLELQTKLPATQPRWNSEGYAFKVGLPDNIGRCQGGLLPVYRAYNDGFAKGRDSNHRYVTDRHTANNRAPTTWTDQQL